MTRTIMALGVAMALAVVAQQAVAAFCPPWCEPVECGCEP